MKTNNQPNLSTANYTCAQCGAKYDILSTKGGAISLDVCSNCHQFYVGKAGSVALKGKAEKLAGKFNAGKATMTAKKDVKTKERKSVADNGLESL